LKYGNSDLEPKKHKVSGRKIILFETATRLHQIEINPNPTEGLKVKNTVKQKKNTNKIGKKLEIIEKKIGLHKWHFATDRALTTQTYTVNEVRLYSCRKSDDCNHPFNITQLK
jgi:hypothetical protein